MFKFAAAAVLIFTGATAATFFCRIISNGIRPSISSLARWSHFENRSDRERAHASHPFERLQKRLKEARVRRPPA